MIAIIDYGVGNLRSVQKAFEYIGLEACITEHPEEVKRASHVVLPGVGAFSDAMEQLNDRGLIPIILETIKENKPFLGICLGMQLLFERSYEGGAVEGLGIFPGEIVELPHNTSLKVPHMGWNMVHIKDNPLFANIGQKPYVYFVHSFFASPKQKDIIIGTTPYGMEITVAVAKDNVFGVQFHPEKSGDTGLQILKNFGGIK